MKSILVPTDFSEVAVNATEFAFELSKYLDEHVILLHAYQRPFLLSSLSVALAEPILELASIDDFKTENSTLIADYPYQTHLEAYIYNGKVVDAIQEVIDEKEVDYVVMGITGSSKLTEILMGSNAITAIQEINKPIFIIPFGGKFKKFEHCLWVHNYEEKIAPATLEEIKKICLRFNSNLSIIGRTEADLESFDETKAHLEKVFADAGMSKINFLLSFSDEETIVNEINEINNLSLIIMTHTLGTESKLFHQDNATLMAFHTHIPLLVLNGF